jgi:nicotinamide mononucleotide (NMN) deamidase PncC
MQFATIPHNANLSEQLMSRIPLAVTIAERLIARHETLAVVESSTAGMITTNLLWAPGASAYFLGGALVNSRAAREALLGIGAAEMAGVRPASKRYATLLAQRIRERLGATWGLAEAGVAEPTADCSSDRPRHTCIAIIGPVERIRMVRTSKDPILSMIRFDTAAISLLAEAIGVRYG